MVVAPDGGFHGTIGGGELEWRAIGFARDVLSREAPSATLDRFTLGPDLGQCCGGSVRLLTEVFDRDRLDEARGLAAREAAGPFVTRGRIGPRGVERLVLDGTTPRAPAADVIDPTVRHPTVVVAAPDMLAADVIDPTVRHPTVVAAARDMLAADETERAVRHPTVEVAAPDMPATDGTDPTVRHPTTVVAAPAMFDTTGTGRAMQYPTAVAVAPDVPAADGTDPAMSSPAVGFVPVVGDAERESRRKGRSADRGAGGARARAPVVLEGEGVIVERFRDARRAVWLFGAGHVGRALMLALAPLPFEVTWIDERAEVFPAAMPANVRPVPSADPAGEVARAPAGALIVVMTHSHARDLAVVHAALAAGRFGYVGLIGSDSKRARFIRRLREAGVAPARIADLVCPIGCPGIASKHPAAIAVGVAAQLLEQDEALATAAATTQLVEHRRSPLERDEALATLATPVQGVAAGATR